MSREAQRLLEMQEQLKEKEAEVNQTEGELTQLKRQMGDRHSCSTVKQAATKLGKSGKAIEDMEARFKEGIKELEADYEWE